MTVWISRRSGDALERARAAAPPGPLAGRLLAVKDNIDVAGFPTTAGCPEFAYEPAAAAPCVRRLEAAGAVVVGKTNMDQFATGLVGTRSPYGVVSALGHPEVVSGGSSSGSAVAVASGEVDLALGTDTAGSGRVPAAMNGIVGLKPTRGLISVEGVVPACLSIDCVSVFARTCAEARLAMCVAADPEGPAARDRPLPARRALAAAAAPRVGVPDPAALDFGDDPEGPGLFRAAVARLEALGARTVDVDLAPFRAAGDLLYGGPWVAERLAAVGGFMRDNPAATLDPVVRSIILGAEGIDAVAAYRGRYALDRIIRDAAGVWDRIDALLVPTVPFAPTIAEVAADPHGVNARLGAYTSFVNLMDLCALALPAGARQSGVPFGVQLVAPALQDALLCDIGTRFELGPAAGARTVRLAVVGAHLRGQPLNHQLTERAARLVAVTESAPEYRLFRLDGTAPPKPGLVRAPGDGVGVELEVWELGEREFGSFVAEVPPPLAIGTVRLASGEEVKGFVCEPFAVEGARDISGFGGWRAYLGSQASVRVP
ncbi:MAG: allophanate hydrolase [Thermoleophilia bacterium]